MKTHPFAAALAVLVLALAFPPGAHARDEVASVIAVKGKARIERGKEIREARVKDGLLLDDAVATLEAARARMLFRDDSVLTLGERSRVDVRQFVYAKGKGGKSLFNLLDGKMRAVVGKTEFEVRTPTAVAAARGTVILFEAGVRDGRKFTTIICLEGAVVVTSVSPRVEGSRRLAAGQTITVFEDEPLPEAADALPRDREPLMGATDMVGMEIAIPDPAPPGAVAAPGGGRWKLDYGDEAALPPAHIPQQPPAAGRTPFGANVGLP